MTKLSDADKKELTKAVYEDLKIAFIHEEPHTLGPDEIEVLLDILDTIKELD